MPEPAVYAIPMRARFRGVEVREGMLLEGSAGWGEFSPFWDYDDRSAAPWLRAANEAADEGWPPPVRERVPVNVTIPAVGPERAAEFVHASEGCRTAKVKVAERGRPPADDLDRVAAVRAALGPGGAVRIDANGAWDTATAIERIGQLDRAAGGLEYVEQPCRTVEELATVRRAVSVPIAADESIRRAEDPLRVARARAADIAVLKVAPLGGVRACLTLAERLTSEHGMPVVVSSALETSVGIAAGVALAAALPELPYACGLATVALLTADVVTDPLLPVDGALPVRRAAPDRALLAGVAAPAEVRHRWEQRLATVAAIASPGSRPE